MVNICFCLFILANNKPTRRDSCPGKGIVFKNKNAVRCCELDGSRCFTPNDCKTTKSYKIAEQKCAKLQMRLCYPSEMADGLCCETGCDLNFDNRLHWQGKYNGLLQLSFSAFFEIRITLREDNMPSKDCYAFKRLLCL